MWPSSNYGGGAGRRQAKQPAPLLYTKHEHQPKYSRGDPLRSPWSPTTAQYDIIYVAPPQYHEMAARALALLDGSPLVAEAGLVIIQIHPKERMGMAALPLTRLKLSDERRYGSTLLMFYEADGLGITLQQR